MSLCKGRYQNVLRIFPVRKRENTKHTPLGTLLPLGASDTLLLYKKNVSREIEYHPRNSSSQKKLCMMLPSLVLVRGVQFLQGS